MEGLRPDVAAAHQRMHGRLGVKRAVKRLPEHLWPGERVDALASGVYGNGAGLFVLTDRRVLLVVEGLVHRATEDFTFDRLTSVEWSSGMRLGRIIVFAGGTRAEMTNVDKTDGRAIVEAVRARMHGGSGVPAQPYGGAAQPYAAGQPWQAPAGAPPPPPGAVPPPPPAPDLVTHLRELAKLRDEGILTEEEFAAQKAKLLG